MEPARRNGPSGTHIRPIARVLWMGGQLNRDAATACLAACLPERVVLNTFACSVRWLFGSVLARACAHTATDFSVLQIRNTVKRNRLTATFDEVRAALSREAAIGCVGGAVGPACFGSRQ